MDEDAGVSMVVASTALEVTGNAAIVAAVCGVGACCSVGGVAEVACFFSTTTLFTLTAVLINIFLNNTMQMMLSAMMTRRRFIVRSSMAVILA